MKRKSMQEPLVRHALAVLLVFGAPTLAAGEPAWPLCRALAADAGGPAIEINGDIHAPLMFCGNNQFKRDEVLVEQLRLAAEAGMPFFVINLRLPWQKPESGSEPDYERANGVISPFREAHPAGYFLLRIMLNPPRSWTAAHPGDCITTAEGRRLPYASPASRLWREEAERLLRGQLHAILAGPHAPRFAGVIVQHLHTSEWFYPETNVFTDYSTANLEGFRAWLQQQYKRDKRLRRAWDSKSVRMEDAPLPTPERRLETSFGPFRDPRKQRPAMDLQRYQSELVADTIAHFAGVVKEASQGQSLAGAFYGYTFELNANGPNALANSGHLALARLLECERLDLIVAPYSYFERGPGEPGHLHLPVDSVALHGKLAIIEDDTYTHLASPPPQGVTAPGWAARTASLDETLDVTRRNYTTFLMHRCGLWYFDLLSDGRWNSRRFWESTALLRRMAAEVRGQGPFRPEVAVAASERAVHYMGANTRPYLLESLYHWRAEFDRIGAPVGYYLQSDLPRLPDSVKGLILPSPYVLAKAEQAAIAGLLERGGTVVYTCAPGIVGPDGPPDTGRVARLTGFDVSILEDAEGPVTVEDAFTGETHTVAGPDWRPRFVITSQVGDTVATYADSEQRAAAARPEGNGVVLYTAVPRLPVATLKLVCRRAGVHMYRDTPGMTAVVGPYLAIHTASGPPDAAEHRIAWPGETGNLIRLTPPTQLNAFLDASPRKSEILAEKTIALYRIEP